MPKLKQEQEFEQKVVSSSWGTGPWTAPHRGRGYLTRCHHTHTEQALTTVWSSLQSSHGGWLLLPHHHLNGEMACVLKGTFPVLQVWIPGVLEWCFGSTAIQKWTHWNQKKESREFSPGRGKGDRAGSRGYHSTAEGQFSLQPASSLSLLPHFQVGCNSINYLGPEESTVEDESLFWICSKTRRSSGETL